MSAERQFFARNPALVAAAKKKHGFICQICKFDFERAYGPLGEGYIEAHHLNPLSERDPSTWTDKLRTSVDEVCVLCANSHRMVHRKRPALSVDDIRKVLRPETVLISVMHANNELGTIQPIAEIGAIVADADVYFHCDAIQSVGKLPVDVNALGVDFLSISRIKSPACKPAR